MGVPIFVPACFSLASPPEHGKSCPHGGSGSRAICSGITDIAVSASKFVALIQTKDVGSQQKIKNTAFVRLYRGYSSKTDII
jgi:hypothetical protein